MTFLTNSSSKVLDPKTSKRRYPEGRIIVMDENFKTFEHVANCLVNTIPAMNKKILGSYVKVDREGLEELWRGPLEQAELYQEQLKSKGLTMAPLRKT